MPVDLSIIIVNFNTRDLTVNCIKSVINNTKDLRYEIILVDNASADGSLEALSKFDIKIIRNSQNLGFSKANNIGIKEASGKAILLLNSDTKTHNNSIKEAYLKLKEADILTVKIKGEDGKNQQAGGFGPNLFNLFCWAFFLDDIPGLNRFIRPYQISDLSFFNQDRKVDWVMGAFFMMKRQVVKRIGVLDENIFMYGEEMEYCRRARDDGFKIKYFSQPEIIHYGMGSSESGEGAILGEYRALKYFFSKYGNKITNFIIGVIIKLSIILRIVMFSLFDKNKARIYEKAYKNI